MGNDVKNDDPVVTERLCQARIKMLCAKIDGIKKAIYISMSVTTTIIVVVELILNLLH